MWVFRLAALGLERAQPLQAVYRTYAAAAAPVGAGAKLWLAAGAGGAVGLTGWAATSTPEQRQLPYLAPVRLARDVWAAGACVADYSLSLRNKAGQERDEAMQACHQRCANRLLALAFANGGVYIKLGQHIAMLDHLLPQPYVLTMREHLLDKCPSSSYEDVSAIIAADLGAPPEQLFASFDPQPIASASLAQVHVARSRADGRKLAVKVQHAGLRESSHADIATIEALVSAVRLLFPEFDYQWLVEEIKCNLPLELDFTHEAANAERCRSNFASPRSGMAGRVYIPRIYHGMTSKRVLTMEFIEGVGLGDPQALRRAGIEPRALSALVAEAFNEMIFIHGDVHADPHIANLLVRRAPPLQEDAASATSSTAAASTSAGSSGSRTTGAASSCSGFQLVLLDHGLYRKISHEFRLQYAGLWYVCCHVSWSGNLRSLIFADVPGIKRHSAAMNAGDAYTLFAGMLTQRPWELIEAGSAKLDHLTVPTDAKSRAQLAGYAAQYAGDIARLLLRMPRELLLLLKTNDCLRSLDATLGQPLNNFLITARYVSRALAEERLAAKPGLKTRLAVIGEVGALEARLWLLQLMAGRGGGRSRAQPGGGSSTAAAPAPPRQQQATAGTQRAPEQAALPALTT